MPFLRNYGVATTINGITLITRNSADFKLNPTLEVGDVKVQKNGGTLTNITTLPSPNPVGSQSLQLSLSQEEMEVRNAVVYFIDQTEPKEWEDHVVVIETVNDVLAQVDLLDPKIGEVTDVSGDGTIFGKLTLGRMQAWELSKLQSVICTTEGLSSSTMSVTTKYPMSTGANDLCSVKVGFYNESSWDETRISYFSDGNWVNDTFGPFISAESMFYIRYNSPVENELTITVTNPVVGDNRIYKCVLPKGLSEGFIGRNRELVVCGSIYQNTSTINTVGTAVKNILNGSN